MGATQIHQQTLKQFCHSATVGTPWTTSRPRPIGTYFEGPSVLYSFLRIFLSVAVISSFSGLVTFVITAQLRCVFSCHISIYEMFQKWRCFEVFMLYSIILILLFFLTILLACYRTDLVFFHFTRQKWGATAFYCIVAKTMQEASSWLAWSPIAILLLPCVAIVTRRHNRLREISKNEKK